MLRIKIRGNSGAGTIMGDRIKHLVLLAFCLGLAACQNKVLPEARPMSDPRHAFPTQVAPQTESLSLPAAVPGQGISDATATRIGAFTSNYLRRGHGHLLLETTAGPASKESLAQIKAVNGILADYGVPLSQIAWRTQGAAQATRTPAPGGPAADGGATKGDVSPLVMSYTRYVASSTPCGDWSKETGSTHDNQTTANFGCATQHNLAVIVSDPADLKRPRQMDASSATRRATVINRYGQGQTTSTPRGQDEKGTVSEIAR